MVQFNGKNWKILLHGKLLKEQIDLIKNNNIKIILFLITIFDKWNPAKFHSLSFKYYHYTERDNCE
jgi:hypothetical protein